MESENLCWKSLLVELTDGVGVNASRRVVGFSSRLEEFYLKNMDGL